MKIGFIGNFQGPGNATGEDPDERHIATCLEQADVEVVKIPRDEIHANLNEKKKDNIPVGEFDIILLAKWNHFTAEMIDKIKDMYKGKLVYWTWDFMFQPHREWWTPDWHLMLMDKCDYYVSGEQGMMPWFKEKDINYRYFNWDSSDGKIDKIERDEKYDVAFTGTYIAHSYRNKILEEIGKRYDLTIFSFDHEKWKEEGFQAQPGLYGESYNQISAQAKIILCMNWVDPMPQTAGYQSNRVGKVTTTGGLPLVHYFPGAERMLSDAVPVFHDLGDAINKIQWHLGNEAQRETARVKAYDFGRARYTTQTRMKEFKILLESL